MKKLVAILLTAIIMLGLCACGSNTASNTESVTKFGEETTTNSSNQSEPSVIKLIELDETNYEQYLDISCEWEESAAGLRPKIIITPKAEANVVGIEYPYIFSFDLRYVPKNNTTAKISNNKTLMSYKAGYTFYESDIISTDSDGFCTVKSCKYTDESLSHYWYGNTIASGSANTDENPSFDGFNYLTCKVYITKAD